MAKSLAVIILGVAIAFICLGKFDFEHAPEAAGTPFAITSMESRSVAPPEPVKVTPKAEAERDFRSRRVLVATASWCQLCRLFKNQNADGNHAAELIYVDIDGKRPDGVTQQEWDRLQAVVRGLYANIEANERLLPNAMWLTDDGKWRQKCVAGWKMAELEKWVK